MLINVKNSQFDIGQSVVEIIIAVSMFTIIAGSAVVAVLGSLSTSRLAEEETQATMTAVEGIEAAASIRNKDWDSLVEGSHGLDNAGDAWAFSGTSDTDPSGKFTRTVGIEPVERDANDDIVASGGTIDPDTKKITSSVTWDFTAARTNTVEMTSYLTNWQEAAGVSEGEPTPTPTDTPTPTPTTEPYSTCSEFCLGSGYSGGTCRRNAKACSDNGETYESGGDQYCTGGPNSDTCCCAP
jgi:type II secretory pathway pseudopilin PulG